MKATKEFDGSRRHVLDWLETTGFLETVRSWVRDNSLLVPDAPTPMPKFRSEPDESRLFNPASPFLIEGQKAELQRWWLAHSGWANIPNWDLIVAATTAKGAPALVLVEAKAHSSELDCKPKKRTKRKTPDAQKRTDDNHDRIGKAIEQASRALATCHSGIHISRDNCYQFANRIAMAWKLASMGISNTLVFLGFTGDSEIAGVGKHFADDSHWQREFAAYASSSFPLELLGQDVSCGEASFRVIARSLPVRRPSRPIEERRLRK